MARFETQSGQEYLNTGVKCPICIADFRLKVPKPNSITNEGSKKKKQEFNRNLTVEMARRLLSEEKTVKCRCGVEFQLSKSADKRPN